MKLKKYLAGIIAVSLIAVNINYISIDSQAIESSYFGSSEQSFINSLNTSDSTITNIVAISNYVAAKYGPYGANESCIDISNYVINMLEAIGVKSYMRYAALDHYSAGYQHYNVCAYIGDEPYIIEADGGTKATVAKASEYTDFIRCKGFYYNGFVFAENNSGELTCYENLQKDINTLEIPSSVTNKAGIKKAVQNISMLRISDYSNIKRLIIPDSITNISSTMAFTELKNLEEVILSKNIKTLPYHSFYNLNSLASINLDNITSFEAGCLYGTAIKNISIPSNAAFTPDGASEVSDYYLTFGFCENLTSATLPENMKVIPGAIFDGCWRLSSIKIPASVTTIQRWAFAGCNSLTLTVPDTVTTFGEDCFSGIGKVICSPNSACAKYCEQNNVPCEYSTKVNIADATVTLSETSYTFNDVAKKPGVTVKLGGKTLTANTDYTVEYKNNINAGTASVIITGKGNYTGNTSATFTINKININDCTGTDFGELEYSSTRYDGTEKKPDIGLRTPGLVWLVSDADYVISYKNNVNAGTATATITGIGNYTGTMTKTFTITPFDMDLTVPEVVFTQRSFIYSGSAIKPTPSLSLDGLNVPASNLTYTYTNNVNVGTANVKITVSGNYSGSISKGFLIQAKDIGDSDVTYSINTSTYAPTVKYGSITLKSGTDYQYTTDSTTKADGYITTTFTGMGNYTGNKIVKTTLSGQQTTPTPAHTHSYGSWITTKAATCTTAGTKTRTCSCGQTETATIAATGHSYTVKTVAPTCTAGGYTLHTCSKCGVSYKDAETNAVGHNYTHKIVAPTCTSEGYTLHTCKTCGYSYKDATTVKTAHNYTLSVVAPTPSADGYTLFTCKDCGHSYKDFYVKYTDVTPEVTTVNISSCASSLASTSYVYTGSAIKPAATVTYNGKALVNGTDYTVTYKNNINKGTATATITGKGNYTGSKDITFSITAKSLSAATLKLSATSYAYSGSARKPGTTVTLSSKTLVKNTDYTVTYKNNINKRTATVIITGKGNYSGTKSTTFTIKALALSKVTVTGLPKAKYYTAKAIKPALTLKYGTKTLKAGTDYTIAYKNNKAIGKATITLKGKGNFSGTVTLNFKIIPKKTTLKTATSPKTKQLKVTYSKVANITGYQIVYSTSSDFSKNKKSVNTKATSKTISSLTKGKTYYVKVRTCKTVSGTKYYSGYSAVKKVKIK